MSTCATRRAGASLACAVVALAAAPASAQDLGWRGDATAGGSIYVLETPWDSSELSSYFDQYRYLYDKDAHPPWFLDLVGLDLGWFREDETPVFRLERASPWAWNDRADLVADFAPVRLEADYHRFRSDALRVFPTGTNGSIPVFGTLFVPDAGPPSAFGRPEPGLEAALEASDRRLYSERTSVDGELRLRLEGGERVPPVLRELALASGFEERQGENQDRFLLDAFREPAVQQARFRANRREIDQQVEGLGGGAVLVPVGAWTLALGGGFERFREDAPVVTLDDLAEDSPAILPGLCPLSPPTCGERPFFFVPDTDRFTGTLRFGGELGPAALHGAGAYTHLRQAGERSPLQQAVGAGKPEVDAWSTSGAFEVPLSPLLSASGFARFERRDYEGISAAAYDAIAGPEGQVDPIYERRAELDTGLELGARPVLGTRVAAGWRYEDVSRSLDFAAPLVPVIQPEFNLLEEDSRVHTVYLRSRARLWRRLQLAGELGWSWAPEVAYPRQLERALSAQARATLTLPRPLPLIASLFGSLLDGENDDIELASATAPDRSKDFAQTRWDVGTTVTVVPLAKLVVFGTLLQAHDRVRFDQLRSTIPRYFGPQGLDFFLDSQPVYTSDVTSVILGASRPLSERLDLSLSSSFSWLDLDYGGKGETTEILDEVDELRQRVLSLEGRLDYELRPGLRLGLGYRFDRYDAEPSQPVDLDTDVHTVSLDVRFDLAGLGRSTPPPGPRP
jgi:hypothetical protein